MWKDKSFLELDIVLIIILCSIDLGLYKSPAITETADYYITLT